MWCGGNCLGFSKITPPYETKKSQSKSTYKVEIIDDIRKIKKMIYVYENRKPILEDDLKLDGYEFAGYFKDSAFSTIFDEPITSNIKIYLKWKKL